MRILFIAQATLSKELGGPKVVLELAEAMVSNGHLATVVGPYEIKTFLKENLIPISKEYAVNINAYLNIVAENYDVIDVDANHLYKFSYTKTKRFLLVARSVLFIPHLLYIKYPMFKSYNQKIRYFIKGLFFLNESLQKRSELFYSSCKVADLINVSNQRDVNQLLIDNFNESKIVQIPYGLNEQKRLNLEKVSHFSKSKNIILFLGTFDYRKGCLDIPKIFEYIINNLSDAELILLGAKGLFQNTEDIYDFFPGSLHSKITIVPSFKEYDLPNLLKECKIAIFPSYLEGLGFSVIESIAAGIPVIAYDSPGSSSILRENYLVPPGDWKAMANKVIYLLENELDRKKASIELSQDTLQYDWKSIATKTADVYSSFNKSR